MTDKGHLTTRHRSMIKSVPNVNNEANNIPDIIDDSGEDPNTDEPANTWSRGDRLRAKTVTIHEAEESILKNFIPVEHSQQHEADDLTSSLVEQSQQGKNFLNQASRSNMNALSVSVTKCQLRPLSAVRPEKALPCQLTQRKA